MPPIARGTPSSSLISESCRTCTVQSESRGPWNYARSSPIVQSRVATGGDGVRAKNIPTVGIKLSRKVRKPKASQRSRPTSSKIVACMVACCGCAAPLTRPQVQRTRNNPRVALHCTQASDEQRLTWAAAVGWRDAVGPTSMCSECVAVHGNSGGSIAIGRLMVGASARCNARCHECNLPYDAYTLRMEARAKRRESETLPRMYPKTSAFTRACTPSTGLPQMRTNG